MNLGENVHNAVLVLQKTYESIDKLIKYCQVISERDTVYLPAVNKFLRYKSDNDWKGWMVNYFILLFQNKKDKMLNNGWRNGAVYAMEINLEEGIYPVVYLSKFSYKDIKTWSPGCSPASSWAFHNPLRHQNMEHETGIGGIIIAKPKPSMEESIADDYWGLQRIDYLKFPLVELTAENMKEKIFNSFDILSDH